MIQSTIERKQFPLFKYLELKAKEDKSTVANEIGEERDTVSEGVGSYDSKSGYPVLPKGVSVPQADRTKFFKMTGCEKAFGNGVIASLVITGMASHPELAKTVTIHLGAHHVAPPPPQAPAPPPIVHPTPEQRRDNPFYWANEESGGNI